MAELIVVQVVANELAVAQAVAQRLKGAIYSQADDGSPRVTLDGEPVVLTDVVVHDHQPGAQAVVRGTLDGDDIGLMFGLALFRGQVMTQVRQAPAKSVQDAVSERVAADIETILPDASDLPFESVRAFRRGGTIHVEVALSDGNKTDGAADLGEDPSDDEVAKAVETILEDLVANAPPY